MPSIQGERRVLVMIELPPAPAVRVMTTLTVGAERSVMMIGNFVAIEARLICALKRAIDMTRLARHEFVPADEWEFGEVVIERDVPPGDRRMAPLAIRVDPCMRIVIRMTVHATRVQRVGQSASVATFAGQRDVGPLQFETRLGQVVETRIAPTLLIMALVAIGAVAPLMRVVGAVTFVTGSGRFGDLHVVQVAACADQRRVSAFQRIARHHPVIETCARPTRLAVAIATIIAAPAGVNIILSVATRARLRGLKSLLQVATLTLDIEMRTAQRKGRGRMIERSDTPVFGGVAAGTVLTQIPLVRLVIRVAGDAFLRCRSMRLLLVVAAATGNRRVRAIENEISERMVEQLGVQSHDVGCSPLVLGVTALAGPQRLEPAMKSSLFSEIVGDLLVAVDAQHILFARIEVRMAVAAVVFEFSMAFDNRSRHHQSLQVCRPGPCRNQGEHGEQDSKYPWHGDQYMCTANTCRMTAATMTRNTG